MSFAGSQLLVRSSCEFSSIRLFIGLNQCLISTFIYRLFWDLLVLSGPLWDFYNSVFWIISIGILIIILETLYGFFWLLQNSCYPYGLLTDLLCYLATHTYNYPRLSPYTCGSRIRRLHYHCLILMYYLFDSLTDLIFFLSHVYVFSIILL